MQTTTSSVIYGYKADAKRAAIRAYARTSDEHLIVRVRGGYSLSRVVPPGVQVCGPMFSRRSMALAAKREPARIAPQPAAKLAKPVAKPVKRAAPKKAAAPAPAPAPAPVATAKPARAKRAPLTMPAKAPAVAKATVQLAPAVAKAAVQLAPAVTPAPAAAPAAATAVPRAWRAGTQIVRDAAARGVLPQAPDFSADTHRYYRAKLAQLVALVQAGDLAAVIAYEINPISSSRKAMHRYRELAVMALQARG